MSRFRPAKIICTAWACALLALTLPAQGQSLDADLLMARIGRALKTENFYEALSAIAEYEKKGLPQTDDIAYAQALALARSKQYVRALPVIKQYLERYGRKGAYYAQALELHAEVEGPARQQAEQQKQDVQRYAERQEIERTTAQYEQARRQVHRDTLPVWYATLNVSTHPDGSVLLQRPGSLRPSDGKGNDEPVLLMLDANTAQVRWKLDLGEQLRRSGFKSSDSGYAHNAVATGAFAAAFAASFTSGGCRLGGQAEVDGQGVLLTKPAIGINQERHAVWAPPMRVTDLKASGKLGNCSYTEPSGMAASVAGSVVAYVQNTVENPVLVVVKRGAAGVQWVHTETLPAQGGRTNFRVSPIHVTLAGDGRVAVTGSVLGSERGEDGQQWYSPKTSNAYLLQIDADGRSPRLTVQPYPSGAHNAWHAVSSIALFEQDGWLSVLTLQHLLSPLLRWMPYGPQDEQLSGRFGYWSWSDANSNGLSGLRLRALARSGTGALFVCGGLFDDFDKSGRKPGPALLAILPADATQPSRKSQGGKKVTRVFGKDAECAGIIPTRDGGARIVVVEGAFSKSRGPGTQVTAYLAKVDAQGNFVPAASAFGEQINDTGPDLEKLVDTAQPIGRIGRINTEWGYAVVELGADLQRLPALLVAKGASGQPVALRAEKRPAPREVTVTADKLSELRVDAPVFAGR